MDNSIAFSVGYTFIRNYAFSDFSVPINANENNIWQQALLKHGFRKLGFAHRFRFEERFIDEIVTDGSVYANRARYRFTLSHPIKDFGQGRKLSVSGFSEIWMDAEEGVIPETFNQNWIYLGLGNTFNKNLALSMGHQNVYFNAGGSYFSNNLLFTKLAYHINP